MRLLIIEDDEKTVRALKSGLEKEGFSVATAQTGEDGFFLLNSESFDVVVLDWMLPGRDGVEIPKILRERGTKTPVLLLTARDSVDRALGLESGTRIARPVRYPIRSDGRSHARRKVRG